LLLDLNIEPTPCPRPRVGRHGAYYPSRYRNWKSSFRNLVSRAAPDVPIRGPVSAVIRLLVRRPRKTSLGWPKPDVDNYAKSVMDGLNGIVWEDDSQVIELRVVKAWAAPNETGKVQIEVCALGMSPAPRAARRTT
jgi:Holliday junction resolvase RusA-like endonuclease